MSSNPISDAQAHELLSQYPAREHVKYHRILRQTERGVSTQQRLSQDPRVVALDGKLLGEGAGATSVTTSQLVQWYLWCEDLLGSAQATAALERFLAEDSREMVMTLWVLGITVDKAIDLGRGIVITPLDEMPPSAEKERYSKIRLALPPEPVAPECALVKRCRFSKIQNEQDKKLALDTWELLRDVSLLLNLAEDVSCEHHAMACYTDITTPFGPFGGGGRHWRILDVSSKQNVRVQSDVFGDFETLLSAFQRKSINEKQRLALILERLSQAKRRTQLEDKILDLGIALEMLLLHDSSDKNQLSMTLRLRGSWLLGEHAEHRTRLYETFKELYKFRSQVAHTGLLDAKRTDRHLLRRKVAHFEHLTCRVFTKLLTEGNPDWDRLLLGAS